MQQVGLWETTAWGFRSIKGPLHVNWSRRPTIGLSPTLRLSFTRLGHISCRQGRCIKPAAFFNSIIGAVQARPKQSN